MAGKIKDDDDCSFKTFICESVADSSSSREEKNGENDAPAVFMCGKCKLPIGDSLSWAGSDEEQNQIMLKRTTNNIVRGKSPLFLVLKMSLDELGIEYISTPKKLDYKRSLFCFYVENIESYVVGSPGQQMPELERQDSPVTLEYQNIVEEQMTEIKSLAVIIGQRLLEIETNLLSISGK